MARKRQYTNRQDYRKGGRVRLAHGNAPDRKLFDTATEYNAAYKNWQELKKQHDNPPS